MNLDREIALFENARETPQLNGPLLAQASQLAEQYQLGQLRCMYRRRLHRFLLWSLPGWLALVGAILAYSIYRLFVDYTSTFVPPRTDFLLQFLGEIVQLVFLITMFVLGIMNIHPFWSFRKRLYIMENGLLYTNGKKTQVTHWDEVESIF